MIFIDQEKNIMGSKAFTRALAERLQPYVKDFLSEDELDDFQGDLLVDVNIYFSHWAQEKFMRIFRIVERLEMGKLEEERLLLLELMQQDPRFILS